MQSASRDPQRSPMQWSDDVNAGFNNNPNATWLPVHPDYRRVNVEVLLKSTQTFDLSLLETVLFQIMHLHGKPLSSRSRRKMKVLFWLSTVS